MIHKIALDVFVLNEETSAVFNEAKQDRRLNRSTVNIHAGGLPAAVDHYADKPTPGLLIVEEGGSDEVMMKGLEKLSEVCSPNTKVVVIGQLNDISLYRNLIDSGVSEYLLSPIDKKSVLDVIDNVFIDPSSPPRGKLIAFYGARGGVGSSTIAHNFAWSLTQFTNEDVALIDADLVRGTAGLAFNVDPKQTLVDALAHPGRLDEVLLEKFMVEYNDQLKLLCAPGNLQSAFPVNYEVFEKVLELVRSMAGCVVVDLPHLWGMWIQQTLVEADEVVVVASPTLACFRDVKNLMDMIGKQRGEDNMPKFVLNNMDAYRKSQLSPKDFEETIGVKPLMSLPFEPSLFGVAANNGQMIGELEPNGKVRSQMRELASSVTGWADEEKEAEMATLKNRMISWLMGK